MLAAGKTVAVIGASPKPDRYAYRALQLLAEHGHRAIPINPAFDEILGQKCIEVVEDCTLVMLESGAF